MILLTTLFPATFGLKWGDSKDRCLTILSANPLKKQSPDYLSFMLTIEGSVYKVDLLFDEGGGLHRIELDLYTSQDFRQDISTEKIEQIISEHESRYADLVEQYRATIGQPNFSGTWEDTDYPEDQGAWKITYWDKQEGRAQIELDQPDKEFPIIIRLTCYLVRVHV